jgi:hypothetical protein
MSSRAFLLLPAGFVAATKTAPFLARPFLMFFDISDFYQQRVLRP